MLRQGGWANCSWSGQGTPHFPRAMPQLDLEVIPANTPPAKGRVARVHPTWQDRRVKELRWRGRSNRTAGNADLAEFLADVHVRFAGGPRETGEAHRPRWPQDDLGRTPALACGASVLTVPAVRTGSKKLTLKDQNGIDPIQTTRPSEARRQAQGGCARIGSARARWNTQTHRGRTRSIGSRRNKPP